MTHPSNKQYNRVRKTLSTPRDRWGPRAVLAILLVLIIGTKFLTSPGVDAADLLVLIAVITSAAVFFFFPGKK